MVPDTNTMVREAMKLKKDTFMLIEDSSLVGKNRKARRAAA